MANHLRLLPLLCLALAVTVTATATATASADFRAVLNHPYAAAGSSISNDKMLRRSATASRARMWRLHARLVTNTSSVPVAALSDQGYTVTVGIGTPPQPQTLILNTASDLCWTQCKLFHGTTRQRGPLYDPARSPSFPAAAVCARTSIPKLVAPSPTSGIISLDSRSASVLSQLAMTIFSYCFTPFAKRKTGRGSMPLSAPLSPPLKPGHLFLGATAMENLQRHNKSWAIQSTPLLRLSTSPSPFCYVQLVGLSLGTRRLAVPAATLTSNPTIVDSGSTIAYLVHKAFKFLNEAILEEVKLPVANRTVEDYSCASCCRAAWR
ncbi:hypothetical protein U9M48_025986 [Paspalum notatum var. saurae]|uniref:Xylanase inhibitor N-terminal domain-containing protein n=1 Tax=Paspalum notatum var. saurae TaxID=547442 RepID=A0AAQ3TRN5_PASNO